MGERSVPPAESRIEVVCRRGVWILALHGEHDIATSPSLDTELRRVAAADGRILVDLSHASFLDSSVIRALATPNGDGSPRVAGVVAPEGTFAARLAGLLALGALLPVHATLAEALRGGSRR